MSKTFKMVLILLVVVSIASAVLAVLAFVGKEKEYMKRTLVEGKLAATLKDKRRLEKELNVNKKIKEETETKIEDLSAKVKTFSLQIEEEKKKSKAATLDLTAKKKDVLNIKEELATERKEKLAISKKLKELQTDYDKAKKDISNLKNQKKMLQNRLSDLEEKSVDLDTIVVNPNVTTSNRSTTITRSTRQALKGSVLVVNKEYSFVVTDLGQKDGAKKDMVFEIQEGARRLGRAQIDKVYDTMSSANILPGSEINNIKKGNLVVESM